MGATAPTRTPTSRPLLTADWISPPRQPTLTRTPTQPSPAQLLTTTTREPRCPESNFEDMQTLFNINAAGPLMVARYFAPLLQKGEGSIGAGGHKGMLVNITARAGSIEDNKLGGWYGYRMAKCALNMANKSLSAELGRGRNKVTCLILNPGVVLTDLSRPYHKSVPNDHLLTSDQSASKLLQIIDKTSNNETGHFYDVDGTKLPF